MAAATWRGWVGVAVLGPVLAARPDQAYGAACVRTWTAPENTLELAGMIANAPDNTCITLAANTVYSASSTTGKPVGNIWDTAAIVVHNAVTLQGQGQESSILGGSFLVPLFKVEAGGHLTLLDLTVANGGLYTPIATSGQPNTGGVLVHNGTLTARNSNFRGHTGLVSTPPPRAPTPPTPPHARPLPC